MYIPPGFNTTSQALRHGATLEMPVANMPCGDRQGGVRDSHGNIWWISQRLVEEPCSP